ncbi:hypothetical protein FOA52_003476 [Chlamydomonas sp. UWO 241]|nr:hypothetical protein FOA52_003476 [Chlamydomonas sp. UWO 241]
MAHGAWSVVAPGCAPHMTMAAHAAGVRLPPAGLPMGMPTWWPPACLLHTSVSVGEQSGDEQAGGAPGSKTSSYRGVSWNKSNETWEARLWDTQAKRKQYIGRYASEEDAARAYDYAALEMHGPDYNKRNFPGELISEPPASLGDVRREHKSSRFIGVCWHKGASAWMVQLWDPEAKRRKRIGYYASEEDAARAYDFEAVKMHGPDYTKRNFPNEVIGEPPVSLGDEMRERKASRFHGMYWHKARKTWMAELWDPEAKRQQHIGLYDSEEDAARAYDHALVKLRGPDYTKRNFPNEFISEPPAARGRKR